MGDTLAGTLRAKELFGSDLLSLAEAAPADRELIFAVAVFKCRQIIL